MSRIWITSAALLFLLSCKKGGSDGGSTPPPPANPPSITIEDLSLFEGNGGTNTFNIAVKLSKAHDKQVTVNYSTVEGFAKAGEDYTAATNQTLTFAVGEVNKNIQISIVADDIREGEDNFKITLASPVNATIADNEANIIIRNDDTRVVFTEDTDVTPTSYTGYNLVWSDEFNAGSLNNTNWTVEPGDGCPGVCGWGNNELEYYTGRPENLFFQDGKMIIEARQENYQTRNYTSAKIVSRGKRSFKFGRVDFRAKLPTGKGIWPAFWMLPQNEVYGGWPRSGEIDIMEVVGHEPNRLHGTLHYGPGPGSIQYNRHTTLSAGTLHDKFHTYSIEWENDEIRWYLDGVQFSKANKTDLQAGTTYPFNEDFFFIINLAVGGNWPGSPNAQTYFPQWLIVDYVRVYQKP